MATTPSTRKLNTVVPMPQVTTTSPNAACTAEPAILPASATCRHSARGTTAFMTAALAERRSSAGVDTPCALRSGRGIPAAPREWGRVG